MKRKFYFRLGLATLLALFFVGVGQVKAQAKVIYGRAIQADSANNVYAWSANDVASKGSATNVWIGQFTIDKTNGLYAKGSGSRSSVLTFNHTDNSIQTIDLVVNTLGNTGNAKNYSYIKLGSAIEIQSNQQNQTGSVIINGQTNSIENANGKNNGNRANDVWTIHAVINTATNTLTSFTLSGSLGTKKASFSLKEETSLGSATYNTVTIGFNRAAGTPTFGLPSIKIAEEAQTVSSVNYTINYTNNNNVIKTVTDDGAVGATIFADKTITVDNTKYILESLEVPTLTLTTSENTLNVPVRKPYTATLNVTTNVNGTSSTETTNLTETDDHDATYTYVYPLYKLSNGVYYKVDDTSAFGETGTFIDGETINKTVNYTTADKDVVFYSEGESAAGTDPKYSNGATGFVKGQSNTSTGLSIGSLGIGSYEATVVVTANAFRGVVVRDAGSTDANTNALVASDNSTTGIITLPFILTSGKTLVINGKNSTKGMANQSADFDYVVIKKVGDPSTTVTINTTSSLASFSNTAAVTVPEGVTIYKASAPSDNTVTLTKVDDNVIPANTGVILYKENGGDVTLTYGGTAKDGSYNGNALKAATSDYTVTESETVYALVAGEQSIAKVSAGVAIPAGKAYLPVAASTTGAKLNLVFGGSTTGINNINVDKDADKDAPAFNLAGQRVGNGFRGIVIKGGKKYIQK